MPRISRLLLPRSLLFISMYIFLGFFLLDCSYLVYQNRVKPRIDWLFRKNNIHALGVYSTCENNTWWSKTLSIGSNSWQHVTDEERKFPIAYTILAFERPDQVWRLLRAIYRPHNYYCIHFDKKGPDLLARWLQKRVHSCLPEQDNVIFIPSVPVYHSYMSVLDADLACMRELWKLKPKVNGSSRTSPWKYLINLTGQEFPLKNNLELVRILSVINGANLVEQLKFSWTRSSWQQPPHQLKLFKGSVHVVLSWEFVNFIFTEPKVQDFLDYLPHVGTPDEAFFSTINHNAKLNAPGNFPYGDEEYRSGGYFTNRWKKFWPEECLGVWRHAVCIFSLAEMKPIFDVMSPYLFVNKFVMHINADVLDITEAWFYSRQDFTYQHQNITLVNLDYFANLPQVLYQKKINKFHIPSIPS